MGIQKSLPSRIRRLLGGGWICYYFSALVVFFLLRCIFLTYNLRFLGSVQVGALCRAFAFGTLVDSSVVATTLFILLVADAGICLLFKRLQAGVFFRRGAEFILGLFFILNLIDVFYFPLANSRANLELFENFSQLAPIFNTIISSYPVIPFFAAIPMLVGGFCVLAHRLRTSNGAFAERRWASALFLFMATFLYLKEPFWRMSWVLSSTQSVRQLSLNGVYNLIEEVRLHSILTHEHQAQRRELASTAHSVGSLRRWVLGSDEELTADRFPLVRRIVSPQGLAVSKPNIVLIGMEGLSASHVGSLTLDHQGLSPNLDALAQDGILFDQIYAHETRTHHGIVGITASFPSLLGTFLTRRYGTSSFYTGFNLLREYGYQTSFVYGYDADFDSKRSFFAQGGVDTLIEEKNFSTWKYKGAWGVSDEDVFAKANETFRSYPKDQPFFSFILTGSNHAPYRVPDSYRKEHLGTPASGYEATFVYADWAIGRFMESARKEAYFKNTIFVFVADHGEKVDPLDLRLKRFHVPLVVYAPGLISGGQRVHTLGTQADILPTLFHLIGYPGDFHFVGTNLLGDEKRDRIAVLREGSEYFVRWKDYVLIESTDGALSALHRVKSGSYLGEKLDEPQVQARLSHDLHDYIEGLYSLLYEGLHQVPAAPALTREPRKNQHSG